MRKRLIVGSLAFILLTVGLANWAQYNYYDISPGARSFFTKTAPTDANAKLVLPEAQPVNILVNDLYANRPYDTALNQSTTTMVLAGTKVVVAYNDTAVVDSDPTWIHPWTKTGWAVSTNGGATFRDMYSYYNTVVTGVPPLPYSAEDNWGQPWMARDPYMRRIYLATVGGNTGNNIQVYRSLNDGVSFADVVNATPNFTGLNFQDKPCIAVDTFAGTGQGNVYLAWRHFDFLGINGGIRLTRSTDGGTTWGPSQGVLIQPQMFLANNLNGANVVVGRDHSVMVFWWQDHFMLGPTLFVSRSVDRGVTFAPPIALWYYFTPNNLGDLGLTDFWGFTMETNAFPQAAVNRVTGHIYLAFNDWWYDNGDILYIRTTDYFANWYWGIVPSMSPYRAGTAAASSVNDQWHPTLAITPDGNRIFFSWYDRFLDPNNLYMNRWGRIATINKTTGAMTWQYPFVISNQNLEPWSSFAVVDLWDVPEYCTDYDSAAADTNYFYGTWSDPRLYDPWILWAYGMYWYSNDVRFTKIRTAGPGAVLWTEPFDALTMLYDSAGTWGNIEIPVAGSGIGGCNYLDIPIYNWGTATATGVNATLQTSTAGVTIDTASVSYGNIDPADGAYYSSVPFRFSTTPAFDLTNTSIEFVMNVTTANAGVFSWHFTVWLDGTDPNVTVVAGLGVCTPTAASQYDMYAYDDYARAAVCVSSSTGAYQWTMLPSGVQYTGTATIVGAMAPFYLQLTSAVGDPKRFSFYQSGSYARASFSYPVAGVASGIIDMNTLDSLWLCP